MKQRFLTNLEVFPMIEENNIEITPRDKKLVNFYEGKLASDPDKAIEKTMKHYNLGKTQVRNIVNKFSQYPTPTVYKNMLKDIEATSSIVADEIISDTINDDLGGVISSGEVESLVKALEQRGLDVKDYVGKSLQFAYHNDIKEATEDNLKRLSKDVPLGKTLKQQVIEEKAKAEIMEAQKRQKLAESSILEEDSVQHIIKETGELIKVGGIQTSEEDRYYDDNYEEMFNDFMSVYFHLKNPSSNRYYSAQLIERFGMKWAFKRAQILEIKNLRAEKEYRESERDNKKTKQKELEHYTEYLHSLPIEDLHKIVNEEN